MEVSGSDSDLDVDADLFLFRLNRREIGGINGFVRAGIGIDGYPEVRGLLGS